MTIPPELEAQILRYYHTEKWRMTQAPRVGSSLYELALKIGSADQPGRSLAELCGRQDLLPVTGKA